MALHFQTILIVNISFVSCNFGLEFYVFANYCRIFRSMLTAFHVNIGLKIGNNCEKYIELLKNYITKKIY